MEPRDESISARSQRVRQRFRDAINKKSTLAKAASRAGSLATIDVTDALERFTLWAGNLGAILPRASRLSLDHRLADAPETSERICEVLDDLAEAITDLLDLLQEVAYDANLNRDEAPGVSALSCEGSGPTSGDGSFNEAQSLLDIISEYLRSLFRIASLVRNAGPRDRFTHAIRSSNTAFTNTLDVSHLREKHPKLPADIRQRLGDANAKRRQFIKYCHDHRTRLETELSEEIVAQVTESQPARTELLSSKATTFAAPIPAQLLKPAPALDPEDYETIDDCVSMVSMSTFSGANMTLRLPRLSVLAPDREVFECPICCTFQRFSLEQEWRAHAFRDLKAYACTFGCPDMYGDKRAWFDHELRAHRRRFACQLCTNTDNLSEPEFRQHLGAAHGDISENQHNKFLDSSWEAMSTLLASDCPFCDDWTASLQGKRDARGKGPEGQQDSHEITVSAYQFMRHVGAHQEQLAIFAVPREADDDSDAGTPDSGTFGFASVDHSPFSLASDDGGDLAQANDPSAQGPVSRTGENTQPNVDADAELGGGSHYLYDTQTPVFVGIHSPGVQQSSSLAPSEAAPPSLPRAGGKVDTNSSSSRDRVNTLPGEEMLYDGAVKTGHSLRGPFEDGHLKAFRNTLSNDLRFYCKLGNNSETLWMKGTKARLVPLYCYDQRSLMVQIRDGDNYLEVRQRQQPHQQQYEAASNSPAALYQFAALKDLFAFQSQLTGEQVVLDIPSVKWIRLAKSNSRSTEMYSSVRLQIWHEPRHARRAVQSDVSSPVAAGTALSGLLRERVIPNSSRLMLFLGRSEEYITSFITDDIEILPNQHTSARLKPRKYGDFHRRNSRPGIRARREAKSGADPAGLVIHGELYSPDVEQSFDLYEMFEIEFHSLPSRAKFVQTWNDIIDGRQEQRATDTKIPVEVKREAVNANR